MKYLIFLYLVTLLLISCSNKEQKTFTPSTHFYKIENLRKAKPLNFLAIAKIFNENLRANYYESHTDIVSKIDKAITAGIDNIKPHIQSQIISKELQKLFYLELIESKDVTENILALKPILLRRGKWVGKEGEYFDIVSSKEASKNLVKETLVKVFITSVFYELQGIEENRGKDDIKCEEKMVEARIFFETIANEINDVKTKNEISAQLNKTFTDIDIARTRELLNSISTVRF